MSKQNPINIKKQPPWGNENAQDWLASFDPWIQMLRLVRGTLQLETKQHPQEIRAAVSMVVLFCRDNLWPVRDPAEIDRILELAVRQLSTIKQLYETKARMNPDMMTNKTYRNLLVSLDQEVRILEARLADPKPKMPNAPPASWGNFWT